MSIRLIYLAIIAAGVILSWRPGWILRGSGFLVLSSIFAGSDALWSLLLGSRSWLGWGEFWVIFLSIGAFARNSWLVSAKADEVLRALEEAARAVWLEGTRTPEGFAFGADRTRVLWRKLGARRGILTFPAKPFHKKLELLKQLFYKKHQPLFPRLTIRI